MLVIEAVAGFEWTYTPTVESDDRTTAIQTGSGCLALAGGAGAIWFSKVRSASQMLFANPAIVVGATACCGLLIIG